FPSTRRRPSQCVRAPDVRQRLACTKTAAKRREDAPNVLAARWEQELVYLFQCSQPTSTWIVLVRFGRGRSGSARDGLGIVPRRRACSRLRVFLRRLRNGLLRLHVGLGFDINFACRLVFGLVLVLLLQRHAPVRRDDVTPKRFTFDSSGIAASPVFGVIL